VSRIDEPVVVTLVCNCRVRLRMKPLRPNARYTCRSNLGHSYNQPWASYEDGGRVFHNPALAAKV
jgi:hypothetical protein